MRILYIDVDSLRPDHLSCYGYPRRTSPTIDAIAARGVRLENAFASDVPCLPSRTSLVYGRHGFRHGAVNHSGTRAQPYAELRDAKVRSLRSELDAENLVCLLSEAGYRTATVSSFSRRHSAWHFLAGFQHVYDTGNQGHELADEVTPHALQWLDSWGKEENWLLHVQYWDVHIPYRTPDGFGSAALSEPAPLWQTDDAIAAHRTRPGIRSARDMLSVSNYAGPEFPRQPTEVRDTEDMRRIVDAYDLSVAYVDHHVGKLIERLEKLGIRDEVAIVLSADHGECLGELNSYCGHNFADAATARVPMIISWPGVLDDGTSILGLHYQMDFAATLLDRLGLEIPEKWDARPIDNKGRDWLVLSQLAQAVQRSAVFRDGRDRLMIYLRTYHAAFQDIPAEMLFDLDADPHEIEDLVQADAASLEQARQILADWSERMRTTCVTGVDPVETVLEELPQAIVGRHDDYAKRLTETNREEWAGRISAPVFV